MKTNSLKSTFSIILAFFFIACGTSIKSSGTISPSFANEVASIAKQHISCVLSDVDGTLLDTDHKISEETVNAIKNVMTVGIPFYLATGRTRKSVVSATGTQLLEVFERDVNSLPGVYQQGLLVYGPDGKLIYERVLEPDILSKVIQFCVEYNIPVVAYCGERIICQTNCRQTRKLEEYSEPIPDEFPDGLENLSAAGISTHKLILLEEESRLIEIRPFLFERFGQKITITKAISGMLEVLPFGSSKGEGVKKLLEHLNISPENTIAFGDGENDVEMLTLVKHGIAVGNAVQKLKDAAALVTLSNNDNGVAMFINEFLKQKISISADTNVDIEIKQ